MNTAERKPAVDESRPDFFRPSAVRMSRGAGPRMWPAVLLVLVALPCRGQNPGEQTNPSNSGQISNRAMQTRQADIDQNLAGNQGDSVYQQKRMRQLNAAQHKSMVSDTEKLLKLVTDLNAEIASSSPASLTSEQLHKVAEIEKLAHSVKEDMRTPVQEMPVLLNPEQRPFQQ